MQKNHMCFVIIIVMVSNLLQKMKEMVFLTPRGLDLSTNCKGLAGFNRIPISHMLQVILSLGISVLLQQFRNSQPYSAIKICAEYSHEEGSALAQPFLSLVSLPYLPKSWSVSSGRALLSIGVHHILGP